MRQQLTPARPDSTRRLTDSRLRLRANPLRLALSASPWLAASYLLSYLILSGLLFAIAVAASAVTAALAVTGALAPLLITSAAVVRGCAQVGRGMLRQVFRQPVPGRYPEPAGPGLWRRARAAWSSNATWRDMAYLTGLWVPLYVLAALAAAIWAALLAGITLPLWYRQVAGVCIGACGPGHVPGVLIGYYPHGPHGSGASGLYIYDSLWPALFVAAGCAVAFLLVNYVLVATALLHARLGRAVLRGMSDPLDQARAVLAAPGPLGPLVYAPPGWPAPAAGDPRQAPATAPDVS